MFVAIHDAEQEYLKSKKFPNLALMKISGYHKQAGDEVTWWTAAEQQIGYDKIYSSKVFDFTPENMNLHRDTIKGGTGYGLYNELPKEIDCCRPDYSIYPECDYAIGFLTRGCINKCSFCIVPKKEGSIRPYAKWKDVVRNDTDKLVLMDNNILACDYGIGQLEELTHTNYILDLNQGMDITLVNDDVMKILSKLKWIKYIRFSCDKEYQLPYFENAIELFKKYKMPVSKIFIYTIVQKDIANAERRIHKLHNICKSFNIYAQAERNGLLGIVPNKAQIEFAQRYIYGRCYKKESWEGYCERHGFNFCAA